MSLKHFEILCKLGEGTYSTVFKVRRYSDDSTYALKKVKILSLKDKEKRNALNEVRILASITHPNIISYKESFFDEESRSLCLIMEYADDGDLYQRILHYKQKTLYMNESYIWNLLCQMTLGLKALHDLSILHRDLKCANVFLMKNSSVKLGDMNVSKISKDCAMHTQTGTPYYASPEVWKDIPYDFKSDLWSLGCILYEAITLKPPFDANNMQELYNKIIKGKYSPIPKHFSQELQIVVGGLLQVNPAQRIGCNQILSSPAVIKQNVKPIDAIKDILIKTIKFPKRMQMISKNLPRPMYVKDSPKRNKSTLMLSVRKEHLSSNNRSESLNNKGLYKQNNSICYLRNNELSRNIRISKNQQAERKRSLNCVQLPELTRHKSLSRKLSSNRSLLL